MRVLIPAAAAALLFATTAGAAPVNVPAWQSTIKYSTTSTGASGFGNYARATSKVVYDAATGTYTLRDTGSLTTTSVFAPANIDATASDATFTVYRKTSGSTVETFRRLNQSVSNPLIVLSYVDYGQWRRATTSGTTTSVNDTYVVFGSKTPIASIPRTGSAAYSTALDGTFVNKDGAYAVSGSGNLTANFAGATIAYDATATGTKEVGSGSIAFGSMTGTGSISFRSGVFTGHGVADTEGYKLDVTGNFYGPAAQEIGGLFRITGNLGQGEGAIVGN